MRSAACESKNSRVLSQKAQSVERRGFTLLELLTVMAIVAILCSLLLPVLAAARAKASGVVCQSNLRQIQAAMFFYAADHEDYVVWNSPYLRGSWVYGGNYGRSFADARGCTNLQWLVDSHYAGFADYITVPSLYRCPRDTTTVLIEGQRRLWSRSYGASFSQRKMSDFDIGLSDKGAGVPPSLHHTFDEVHPGYLICLNGVWVGTDRFITFPAYRHHNAGTLAFADGHVELHHWSDSWTLRPVEEAMGFYRNGSEMVAPGRTSRDLEWLWQRSDSGVGYNHQDLDIMRILTEDPDRSLP